MSHNPVFARGMADVAFEAYALAAKNAGINIYERSDRRVVQAIGDAAASKGYHHLDGELDGHAYTAAADISIKGLSNSLICTFIDELARTGWVAFFRRGGVWAGNEHLHANFCGLPMKNALDGQNEDFFKGFDGLKGHRRIDDEDWYPELELRKIPEAMFRLSNPRNGNKGVVNRAPIFTKPPVPENAVPTNGFFLNAETAPRFWMPVYDDVSYAPVRAFGSALGFDTTYHPDTKTVSYDDHDDLPIQIKFLGGVAHAPIRELVREVGLKIASVDTAHKKVVVTR